MLVMYDPFEDVLGLYLHVHAYSRLELLRCVNGCTNFKQLITCLRRPILSPRLTTYDCMVGLRTCMIRVRNELVGRIECEGVFSCTVSRLVTCDTNMARYPAEGNLPVSQRCILIQDSHNKRVPLNHILCRLCITDRESIHMVNFTCWLTLISRSA